MRVPSLIISNKVLEWRYIRMGIFILDNSIIIKNMGKGSSIGSVYPHR